ncbi:MAG: V4R domain-containing protein [Anaerolineales bacterium]
MASVSQSGLRLPNRFASAALQAIGELVDAGTMAQFLSENELDHLVDNYPPANLERGFDFAEFSALNLGLEKKYGVRGGRSSAARVGGRVFMKLQEELWPLLGRNTRFRALPVGVKLRVALPILAQLISKSSDQICTVRAHRTGYDFLVSKNAVCWGRRNEEKPVCAFFVGFLSEAVHQITSKTDFRVDEVECLAAAASFCRFAIQAGNA